MTTAIHFITRVRNFAVGMYAAHGGWVAGNAQARRNGARI